MSEFNFCQSFQCVNMIKKKKKSDEIYYIDWMWFFSYKTYPKSFLVFLEIMGTIKIKNYYQLLSIVKKLVSVVYCNYLNGVEDSVIKDPNCSQDWWICNLHQKCF